MQLSATTEEGRDLGTRPGAPSALNTLLLSHDPSTWSVPEESGALVSRRSRTSAMRGDQIESKQKGRHPGQIPVEDAVHRTNR